MLLNGLRLSASTDSVPTADVQSQTLYLVPHFHGMISLFNGTFWQLMKVNAPITFNFGGLATGNNIWDVFAYINNGTVALEIGSPWFSTTARAADSTLVKTPEGVWVKTGNPTKLWIGTFKTINITNTTLDKSDNRWVWNFYNQVERPLLYVETTPSWTYNSPTIRSAKGTGTSCFTYVTGLPALLTAEIIVDSICANGSGVNMAIGVGVDTQIAFSNGSNHVEGFSDQFTTFGPSQTNRATYSGINSNGFHTIYWNESMRGSTQVVTCYGNHGVAGAGVASYMAGRIFG